MISITFFVEKKNKLEKKLIVAFLLFKPAFKICRQKSIISLKRNIKLGEEINVYLLLESYH